MTKTTILEDIAISADEFSTAVSLLVAGIEKKTGRKIARICTGDFSYGCVKNIDVAFVATIDDRSYRKKTIPTSTRSDWCATT